MAGNTQKPFKITIEKPYYGWVTTMNTAGGFGGHALEGSFNLEASYSGYQEYSFSSSMMPNRPGYEGNIAPGPGFAAASDAGSIVNGLALNSTIANDGIVYVLLDSNRYVTLSSLVTPAVSQSVFGAVGAAVGSHAAHVGFTTVNSDVVNYSVSGTSTAYAYMTWEDGTDGDIGQYQGTSGTANFYTGTYAGSTALTKGVPHPLLVGQDRFIYFGNGQYLGKFNPRDSASFADQALVLPPYWRIQGLSQYANFIAVAAWQQNASPETPTNKGQSMLFLWDGFSPTWNFQYDMQDFFVSNIFYDGLNLYVLTFGRNNTLKLKMFNGVGFDLLWESPNIGNWPGGVSGVNPCFGGVDLWLNHLVWTSSNGSNINSYGSPSAGNYPEGFHQIASLNSQNGMIKNLFQNTVFIGNKLGSTYTIQYNDFTKFDTSTQFVSEFYALPTNSTIDNVKLYFSQWGAGAALNVALVKDYNAIGQYGFGNDLLQWNPKVSNVGTTITYAYISKSIPNVNGFGLAIQWAHLASTNTAAIIRKVKINGFSDENNI